MGPTQTEVAAKNFEPGKFYVIDAFATTATRAYASGPFETYADAEIDRLTMNFADDCEVWQAGDWAANVPTGKGA